MLMLEKELTYLGGMCSAALMRRDISLPPGGLSPFLLSVTLVNKKKKKNLTHKSTKSLGITSWLNLGMVTCEVMEVSGQNGVWSQFELCVLF